MEGNQMMFNGKNVLSQDDFDYSTAHTGDYVQRAVVDDAMDCLPPKHNKRDLHL